MNLLIPLALGSGILIFTWTAIKDHTGLIIFDVFYGVIMAAAQGLFPPSLGSLTTDMSKMGIRNGMVFSVVGIAQLIGTPIGGALISANNGKYLYAQLFGGLSICVGVSLVFVARCYKTNMTLMVRA
jgi:MFS family permease